MPSQTETSNEDHIEHLLASARRMARRWCTTAADADDVAQDAIIRLWSSPEQPRNAMTWLAVVTRRLCNRLRLRAHVRGGAEEAFGCGIARDGARPPAPEVLLDVERILTRLEERDRRLMLRVIEGRLTGEIASELGCGTRDIGQMVSRARGKARKLRDTPSETARSATPPDGSRGALTIESKRGGKTEPERH
jgi:RNA polymerase sigma factor (sigma-70 family)